MTYKYSFDGLFYDIRLKNQVVNFSLLRDSAEQHFNKKLKFATFSLFGDELILSFRENRED